MKNRLFLSAACACLLLVSWNAHSSLVSEDWKTTGDNLITLDTITGLEWLDLTETRNISRDYVLTQFGSGGEFAGYRYATSAEVVDLWSNFGINLNASAPFGSTGVNSNLITATSILGNPMCDYVCSWYPYGALGFTSDHPSGDPTLYYELGSYYYPDSNTTYYVRTGQVATSSSGNSGILSHYLVVAQVPVPPTLWLFGSGLLGLFGISRRKKAV